jgi:hypothetical protein
MSAGIDLPGVNDLPGVINEPVIDERTPLVIRLFAHYIGAKSHGPKLPAAATNSFDSRCRQNGSGTTAALQ